MIYGWMFLLSIGTHVILRRVAPAGHRLVADAEVESGREELQIVGDLPADLHRWRGIGLCSDILHFSRYHFNGASKAVYINR